MRWPPGLNDVEVEDVSVAGNFVWKSEVARILEACRISRRASPACVVPFIDVFQFRAENTRVDIVQAAVVTHAVT